MFSTIHDAWGSNFRETKEMFLQSNVPDWVTEQHPHIEHFCPTCKHRMSDAQKPLRHIPNRNEPLIKAVVVGIVTLFILSMNNKKN